MLSHLIMSVPIYNRRQQLVHTAQYSHTVAQGAGHYRGDIVINIRVELDNFNNFKQELVFSRVLKLCCQYHRPW